MLALIGRVYRQEIVNFDLLTRIRNTCRMQFDLHIRIRILNRWCGNYVTS